MDSIGTLFVGFIFLTILTIIARILWLIFTGRNANCPPRNDPVKALIVVGSGRPKQIY